MPNLKQITLPSGTVYDLWDTDAHDEIEELKRSISGGMRWVGVTTTPLTDGSTTNPIVIGGDSHTAIAGDVAQYDSEEFAFNGTAWQRFGPAGTFGALAFKDSASTTYTPSGSVSQPTFTGAASTISVDFTPAGTISAPSFCGSAATITGSVTPNGSVSISTGSGTANYTPAGTVSQPSFTGSSSTFSASYTPAGSVSAPVVTPSTTTVNSITAVGSLPSLSFTVANENLTIAWDAGSLPTKGDNTTVATGISSVSAPSFSGSAATISATGTPNGSVSQPSFSGTGTRLTAGFTGSASTVTAEYTPSGTISAPSFSGTSQTATAEYTPSGTVTKPSFTGTQATITVS